MSPELIAAIQPKLFMSLICALNMIPCWLLRRDMRGHSERLLNGATLAFGIGLPMLLFKDWLPRTPTVIVGNMLVLAAMTLLWQVVAGLSGRPIKRSLVAVAPTAWLLCWLFPPFRAELDLRIAVAAAFSGLLIMLPVLDLLRAGARNMPLRLLVATGVLHGAVSMVRLWLAAGHIGFAAFSIWSTVCQLNTLTYMMLWPALCTVQLNRWSLEAEEERGRRDELSGLLNRRGMLFEIARTGPATLMLFDIDHFKRINDRFGHASGDDAIVAFAGLAARLLGSDLPLARIGGEEFVALVPWHGRHAPSGAGCHQEIALAAAEHIRSSFAALVLPVGVSATVSVGVAPYRAGEPAHQWLARADRALYRAKRQGRNRVELCDGLPGTGQAMPDDAPNDETPHLLAAEPVRSTLEAA